MADYYSGNFYLTQEQMEVNATFFANKMLENGFTLNAICGMLGNFQVESTINPAIWQGLTEYSGGYGLAQWTPYTQLTTWAEENGMDASTMETQIYRIVHDSELGYDYRNYYATTEFPETFSEYKISTKSVAYLVEAFEANYERAGAPNIDLRIQYGIYWFDFLQNLNPSRKRRKLPLYMMVKPFRRRLQLWR